MMTGPGLALFYGGLVRKKNVLGTMMHSFALMAIVTVLWAIIGYSLCFASGTRFIGGFGHIFLRGVGAAPDADYAATIPQQSYHGLPVDVCHHHARLDHRRLCRAHEVQRHGAVHGPVVPDRLRPHGAHGVGQRRPAELQPGRALPDARFRRRHGGARHLRGFGAGVRVVSRQTPGISQGIDSAAQRGAQLHRRLSAVGGMVRLQRGKRAGLRKPGHQRVRGHAFCRRCRRGGLGTRRVVAQRQTQRAGRHLGRGRRTGCHHSGFRVRGPDARARSSALSPASSAI